MADNGYTLDQVDRAERMIRTAVPGALFDRGDYGFTLAVANAARTKAFIVFRPGRDDIGQTEVISDDVTIDSIIARLV